MENGLLKKRAGECSETIGLLARDAAISSQADTLAKRIIECYNGGGKVILLGNGGSASQALHIAAEFEGKYLKDRRALPAIALGANQSTLTAIGNDYDFAHVFVRQLEAHAKKGDVVIALSTSGNSPNVVEAIKFAKAQGIFSATLTGKSKCKLDGLADINVKVPSFETPRIQEAHLLILHTVCEMAESSMFP